MALRSPCSSLCLPEPTVIPSKAGTAETFPGPSCAEASKKDQERLENSGLGIKVEGEIAPLTQKQHDPEIQAAEAVLWTFTPVPSHCL